MRSAAHKSQINFDAYDEHEQHEAEIGEDIQIRTYVIGKQLDVQVARKGTEQRTSEQQAGHDLAGHCRLAHLDEQLPNETGDHDNNRYVEEYEGDRVVDVAYHRELALIDLPSDFLRRQARWVGFAEYYCG